VASKRRTNSNPSTQPKPAKRAKAAKSGGAKRAAKPAAKPKTGAAKAAKKAKPTQPKQTKPKKTAAAKKATAKKATAKAAKQDGGEKGVRHTAQGGLIPSRTEARVLAKELERTRGPETLEGCLELGEAVLKRFYKGSLEQFRKQGTRGISFRSMSADPETPVNGLALYRALMIYNIYHQHNCARFEHNGMTHFRAVFNMPAKEQAKLLERSEREKWTVNRITHEASVLRGKAEGGRMPKPQFMKTLHGLRHHGKPGFPGFADLDRVDDLKPEDRTRMYQLATELSGRLRDIAKLLKAAPKQK